MSEIPYGYCHCGCGKMTDLASQTKENRSHVKGKPFKFLHGHHNKIVNKPPIERFWKKVIIKGIDDCWEWSASKNRRGYGQFDRTSAHRFSWTIDNGPILDGLLVCHKCDNPGCVNPNHLFLGTCADNLHDMMEKGRKVTLRGEKSLKAKLTLDQVEKIRRVGLSRTQQSLACEYGVTQGCIWAILNNKTWIEKEYAAK